MGYIADLRALVGSRPLIMIGAAVLITNARGAVLLQLRTDNDRWGLIGGALEPGESLEECARREAAEETGLAVGDLTLIGIFSGPELYYRYPHGDEVYNVVAAYRAVGDDVPLRIDPTEGRMLRYFALDALPEALSPPDIPVLTAFRAMPPHRS